MNPWVCIVLYFGLSLLIAAVVAASWRPKPKTPWCCDVCGGHPCRCEDAALAAEEEKT